MYFPQIDEAITLYLKRTGETQADLASEMGMASNTFSWKRRGVREWSLSELVRLSQILGRPPSELLGSPNTIAMNHPA